MCVRRCGVFSAVVRVRARWGREGENVRSKKGDDGENENDDDDKRVVDDDGKRDQRTWNDLGETKQATRSLALAAVFAAQ